MYRKNKDKKIKWFLVVVATLVLLGGIVYILEKRGITDFYDRGNNNDSEQSPQQGTNDINYQPPTVQEQDAGDNQKDIILEDNENNNQQNTDSNKKEATLLITDVGQYGSKIEVRSFIPDYFEDGSCTIQFSKGNTSFQKIVPAFKDSSTTICTNPDVDRSEFNEPGEWYVKVTYESPTARAESTKAFIIE